MGMGLVGDMVWKASTSGGRGRGETHDGVQIELMRAVYKLRPNRRDVACALSIPLPHPYLLLAYSALHLTHLHTACAPRHIPACMALCILSFTRFLFAQIQRPSRCSCVTARRRTLQLRRECGG